LIYLQYLVDLELQSLQRAVAFHGKAAKHVTSQQLCSQMTQLGVSLVIKKKCNSPSA
jgi:hypothetical protein